MRLKHRAKVRHADPSEARRLTELALRSKAHWGYSNEFIIACRAELTITAENIAAGRASYFVCEDADRLIGFYAISRLTEREYELEALFVEPRHIGRGYGRLLMAHTKAEVFRRGAKSILIQSDPNSKEFYLAAGGTYVGECESGSIPGRFLPEFRIELAADNAA
jgi:GNAT superfamily N-acetyltransferase